MMEYYKKIYYKRVSPEEFFSKEFQALSIQEQRMRLYGKSMAVEMNKRHTHDEIRRKKKEKRFDAIRTLREKNLTLGDIGKIMGVSRERIRQLETIMGLSPRGHTGPRVRAIRLKRKCKNPKCKKEMSLVPSLSHIKYCSRKCWLEMQPIGVARMSLKEKREYWNKRTRKYYHEKLKNNPKFIAKTKERNLSYKLKMNEMKSWWNKTHH